MRDFVLLSLLLYVLFFIVKRPYIGTSLWIWAAFFYPKGWVWGFANSIRFNFIISMFTIISLVFSKNRSTYKISGLTLFIFLFLIWGTISALTTISDPNVVWKEWDIFIKIIIFYFVITLTLTSKHAMHVFLWALIIAVTYYGAGEGVKYLATGGGHVVKGVYNSRMGDRNELALALNMVLPLAIFLYSITKHKVLKMGLMTAIVLNVVAIIGSYSRGGFLGLVVVAIYFFLKSEKKLLITLIMSVVLVTALNFVPKEWSARMNTISTMEEDNSFLGRAAAWKQAVLMASDHPFFGGGFKAGQNFVIWKIYEPEFRKFDHIIDTSGQVFTFGKAAHSIYFQVLGDMGYCGLILFLIIIWLSYKKLKFVIKESNDKWIVDLARMLQVSLVTYCAAGAALSLPYFDLSFSIFALSHCLYELTRKMANNKRTDHKYG